MRQNINKSGVLAHTVSLHVHNSLSLQSSDGHYSSCLTSSTFILTVPQASHISYHHHPGQLPHSLAHMHWLLQQLASSGRSRDIPSPPHLVASHSDEEVGQGFLPSSDWLGDSWRRWRSDVPAPAQTVQPPASPAQGMGKRNMWHLWCHAYEFWQSGTTQVVPLSTSECWLQESSESGPPHSTCCRCSPDTFWMTEYGFIYAESPEQQYVLFYHRLLPSTGGGQRCRRQTSLLLTLPQFIEFTYFSVAWRVSTTNWLLLIPQTENGPLNRSAWKSMQWWKH